MKEFVYTIKEPVGIHARPAGMLAKEAKACQSTVTIVDKNGKSVDATRLMALMGMGLLGALRPADDRRHLDLRPVSDLPHYLRHDPAGRQHCNL